MALFVLSLLVSPVIASAAPIAVQCQMEGPVYHGELVIDDVKDWPLFCRQAWTDGVNTMDYWRFFKETGTVTLSLNGLDYVNEERVEIEELNEHPNMTCDKLFEEVSEQGLQAPFIQKSLDTIQLKKVKMTNQHGHSIWMQFQIESTDTTLRRGYLETTWSDDRKKERCAFVMK